MTFFEKYKRLAPSLLFTVAIVAIRIVFTGSIYFGWILLNIMLAAIPLALSWRVNKALSKRAAIVYAALWLLFFPNSFYVITDIIHLDDQDDFPQWYSLLILFAAALNGVIMGLLSLYEVERWLMQVVKRQYVYPVIFCLFLLCGYGLYLGRYLRWNSWDIVVRPAALMVDILTDIVHPYRNIQGWMISLFFGVWLYLLYRTFGRMRIGLPANKFQNQ